MFKAPIKIKMIFVLELLRGYSNAVEDQVILRTPTYKACPQSIELSLQSCTLIFLNMK